MQSKREMKREYRRTIRRLKKLAKKETVAEAKFNRLSSRIAHTSALKRAIEKTAAINGWFDFFE